MQDSVNHKDQDTKAANLDKVAAADLMAAAPAEQSQAKVDNSSKDQDISSKTTDANQSHQDKVGQEAKSEEKASVYAEENQYHPMILSYLDLQQGTSFIRGYKRFWPFLKPFWALALLGILLTIPVGALDAVIALFLKPFTENIMVEQQAEAAAYIPFVIVGFTIVQGLFLYTSSIVNSYVGGSVNLSMRSKLYNKLLSFDSRFFDVNNSGSVMQRFNSDVEAASAGLIENLKFFLTKFFSSLSLVFVLIYNSWQLTILAVGVVVLLIIPMRIVRRKVKRIVAKSVSTSTSMLTLYNESTLGSKVIKSFNLKDYMYRRFYDKAEFLFKMNLKMVRDTNWLSPVMHLVTSLGVALVLYFGVDMIISGELSSGEFISFLAALIMLYTPLKSIGNNFIQVQTALLALDRIYDLLDYESFESGKNEGTKVLTTIKKDIEFSHVAFSYNGEVDVLKDVSFKVNVGQKVALVGNSGGGKTTVCSLITRLYEIKRGTIKIDGVDIHDYTLDSLRSQAAFVFQDNFLFEGTIRDNILLGKADATQEEIDAALKSSFLDEFVKTLPNGVDTQIGERGVSLSGGQKQRLAIARAIIRNSPLVILDEATSALDNRSEKVVQKALDELMKGRTTLVIAHRLSTIRDADVIMVVNDGYIVEQGSHEELLAKNGAYSVLYNSQFKAKELEEANEDDSEDLEQ